MITVELEINEEMMINATIEPEDATNQEFWFSSNNEEVATVSQDGMVKAVSEGEAVVSVTTADGGFIATVEVSVIDNSDNETPEEDKELELGKSQEVQAGINYLISGSSAQIEMPADLPEGTTLIVESKEVTDTSEQDITSAGEAFTFTFDYPQGAEEPAENFILVLGYETGADTDKLAIYYYNEETNKWEHRGGEVDETNQVIRLEVSHFSTYGIFAEVEEGDPSGESP